MIAYTRLKSGAWGVRSTSPLKAGQSVTVTKKSGKTKTEKIDRVLFSGNGVWIASLRERERMCYCTGSAHVWASIAACEM